MVLVGMMIFYGVTPTAQMLWLPVFILLTLITALGVGIGMSALNAKYRDVGYAVPFIIQLLLSFHLSRIQRGSYPTRSRRSTS